jgi:hypothetical protein
MERDAIEAFRPCKKGGVSAAADIPNDSRGNA